MHQPQEMPKDQELPRERSNSPQALSHSVERKLDDSRIERALGLARTLIKYHSVSGEEREVALFLSDILEQQFGVRPLHMPVVDNRINLYLKFGIPEVLFTTHLDVVDGKPHLFDPPLRSDVLYGRGACDAKGIVASLVEAASLLREAGETNFGLLFVVGEEADGIGAKRAAEELKYEGIRFLVNGEPTEGKLAVAHRGAVGFEAIFRGKAAHSGYPECGIDANRKMIEAAWTLYQAEEQGKLGSDSLLGTATLNIGVYESALRDSAAISPQARMSFAIRSVTDNNWLIEQVRTFVEPLGELKVRYSTPAVRLKTVPGFQTEVMKYCSDIPNFAPLGAECLMYGPGSIHVAHSDDEHISRTEIGEAISAYERICRLLKEGK